MYEAWIVVSILTSMVVQLAVVSVVVYWMIGRVADWRQTRQRQKETEWIREANEVLEGAWYADSTTDYRPD